MNATTRDEVDRLLAEHEATRSLSADPQLAAVAAAIFIEAAFDIELGDAEIDPAVLGSAPAMRRLVLTRLGLA